MLNSSCLCRKALITDKQVHKPYLVSGLQSDSFFALGNSAKIRLPWQRHELNYLGRVILQHGIQLISDQCTLRFNSQAFQGTCSTLCG
jgi:hypothetical protein